MNQNSNTAKVSVIVPVYNSEQYLHRCIQSLFSQTSPNWEAIFINDGSTDDSLNILQSYAISDERIQIINQSNAGAAAARNTGLHAIKTEYFTFLDSDDCLHPEFINNTLSAALTNNCDLVVTALYFNGTKTDLYFSGSIQLSPHQYFKHINPGPFAKLYKKSITDKFHIRFPEDMMAAEDYVFTSLYGLQSKNIYALKAALYFYNFENPTSLMHNFCKGSQAYEQYQYHMEAPWRIYQQLIANDIGENPHYISEAVSALYGELWRMYYASKKYLSKENKKRLDKAFAIRRRDFHSRINPLKRLCTWQRHPRLYRFLRRISQRVKKCFVKKES